MTRVRSRKERSGSTTTNRERIDELKKGRRRRRRRDGDWIEGKHGGGGGAEHKEPISATTAIFLFVLICCIGGFREYFRVKGSSNFPSRKAADSDGSKTPNLRGKPSPMAAGVLDHSFLTAEEDAKLEFDARDQTRYHLIFSTDCSPYQHWQSYLVYFTAMQIKQPGHVTRIASGCSTAEGKKMQQWFDDNITGLSHRFHLHLTPHFSAVKNGKGEEVGDYKFFNKPFGLKHWMEEAAHFDLKTMQDDIVILIDPDMALLRPITRYADASSSKDVVLSARRKDHVLSAKVVHGVPFAQTYGLGTQWKKFNLEKIAGADSPALQVSTEDAGLYFPAGPPYIATVKDMYQIALKWTEFVPGVHAEYSHLLAEMYAYCIAAAHLQLKHQLVDSYMVSNTEKNAGEGWELLDEIPSEELCDFASKPLPDKHPVPNVVHLCQRYSMGDDWFFGKRKVPHDIYSCEKPLLELPPSDLATKYTYRRPPNQHEPKEIDLPRARRETFMLCYLHTLLNEAATHYKQKACLAGTANLNKTLHMVDLFKH